MVPFDLHAEVETIGHDRLRVCQCEVLGEVVHAASLQGSLFQARDREIFQVKALGGRTPDVSPA
jgi:hypothetical protein